MEMNTVRDVPKESCTGCGACMNICPENCIAMIPDEEGFLRPFIHKESCAVCGICYERCPVRQTSKTVQDSKEPECYAAWSKDDEIRFHSTSGGAFTHLALAILKQGGAVVGARYRENHLVEHALVTQEVDLEALRQSKYVQSEIGFTYRKIQGRLEKRQPVLFVGTPCQCAGLKSFLGREDENLYLCDFVCRGVNSPAVYLAYLRELEECYHSSVKRVWFKHKIHGWNNFCTKIIFENGQAYLADRETDPFMLGYIKSKLSCYMRPSCYQCHFKGLNRSVNITLGDFWGIEKQFSDIDVRHGVSLILLQDEKGKQLFNTIKPQLDYRLSDNKLLRKYNGCAFDSVPDSSLRFHFFCNLKSEPFSSTIQNLKDRKNTI